jgi:cytoskeleton protein RodZ
MDDFGGKLRQARERRGISLRQIAASTKISAAALEALERNDISKLPGGIFSRAFVRSYASEVGLNPDDTVREFLERFQQEPAPSADALALPVPEEERAYQELQRKAARILGIAAVALPVLAILLYFGLRGRSKSQSRLESPQSDRDISAPSAPQPLPSRSDTTPAAPAAAETGAPSAVPTGVTGAITLDVHPTSDCWVSLTIDDQKLFARLMKAGEHESHLVRREAVVEVGNAGAFAFSIDGRPGKPIGDEGKKKTLKLTPETASKYLQ